MQLSKNRMSYGIGRTWDGEWWLTKRTNGAVHMFKQYDNYEDIEMAVLTEDLDKLWEEFLKSLEEKGIEIK